MLSRSQWSPSLVLVALAFIAPRSGAESTQTFPTHVDVVRAEVVVLDKDRKPVTGLHATDFEVKEDGKLRPVVSFEPVVVHQPVAGSEGGGPLEVSRSQSPDIQEGRYFLIFFDDVHIGPVNSEFVRKSLRSFLEHDLRDGDWVTLVAPLSGVWWTARTPWEREQLPEIVRRLNGRLTRPESKGAYEAMNKIDRPYWNNPGNGMHEMAPLSTGAAGNVGNIGANVETEALYATVKRLIRTSLEPLRRAVDALSGFRGHKTLLFYSQGFLLVPGMNDFDRVIDLARRNQIAVDFIDASGLRSGIPKGLEPADPSTPDWCSPLMCLETEGAGATRIAYATGGRAAVTNDFDAPMREALDQSMAYYLVGYEPMGTPKEHHVSIRVRGQGLTVQTRARYLSDPEPPTDPPVVRALHAVFDATDLPIRVGAFFGAPIKDEVETTLAVDAAPNTRLANHLKLAVELRPRDGKKLLEAESEVSLASGAAVVKAALVPGVWQARVVIRDPSSGKVGSALHTFEVPATTGFRMSTPVLTDKLESDGSPRIELDPVFVPTAVLHCRYEVFGATPDTATGLPRVTSAYTLELEGHEVAKGEPAGSQGEGRILGIYDVPLSSFPPGAYTLALHVADEVTQQSHDERKPVRVVAP